MSFPRVDEKNWFRMLDETKWLNHIQVIFFLLYRFVGVQRCASRVVGNGELFMVTVI